MSRSINVTIDDDVWRLLERIPSRERNKLVSEALKILGRQRRRPDDMARMDALLTPLPRVKTAEVMRWIREDWEHGR